MRWEATLAMLICLVAGFLYGAALTSEVHRPVPVTHDLDHQQITAYCADGVFITARIDVTREGE